MTKRIEVITSLVEKCKIFADVGCDHGYVAKNVLDKGLCEKVYVTDISKPSLDKAIALLSESYPDRFTSFLTDGLENVPCPDEVLIAGMGGEEIIKILQKSAYKPVILILQPMKNADKVRKYLHFLGYGIEKDFTFYQDNKFYDVMRARLNFVDSYTETEELYGRDNLRKNPDFLRFLDEKIRQTEVILKSDNLQSESEKTLTKRLDTLRGIKDEIKRDL